MRVKKCLKNVGIHPIYDKNDWINNSYPENDSAEAKQIKLLLDMTESKFISNTVHIPTRSSNILDFCFVSNRDMIGNCETIKCSNLLDHILVLFELLTSQDDLKMTNV